jgi:hypothetical protein
MSMYSLLEVILRKLIVIKENYFIILLEIYFHFPNDTPSERKK